MAKHSDPVRWMNSKGYCITPAEYATLAKANIDVSDWKALYVNLPESRIVSVRYLIALGGSGSLTMRESEIIPWLAQNPGLLIHAIEPQGSLEESAEYDQMVRTAMKNWGISLQRK